MTTGICFTTGTASLRSIWTNRRRLRLFHARAQDSNAEPGWFPVPPKFGDVRGDGEIHCAIPCATTGTNGTRSAARTPPILVADEARGGEDLCRIT